MAGRTRSLTAALAAAVFAAVELLAPAPEFHRHADELGLLAMARATGPASRITRPAFPPYSGSRSCPACAVSGMSALASYTAPAFELPSRRPDTPGILRADPSVFSASAFDGRAPPPA